MAEFAVDTVAFILRLEGRRLPLAAAAAFDEAEAGRATLHVPTMVFAEILYLAERGRIAASLTQARSYMSKQPHCQEAPLTLAIVETASRISDIPELHDRLIAATAANLDVPLLTNDAVITRSSAVSVVW